MIRDRYGNEYQTVTAAVAAAVRASKAYATNPVLAPTDLRNLQDNLDCILASVAEMCVWPELDGTAEQPK